MQKSWQCHKPFLTAVDVLHLLILPPTSQTCTTCELSAQLHFGNRCGIKASSAIYSTTTDTHHTGRLFQLSSSQIPSFPSITACFYVFLWNLFLIFYFSWHVLGNCLSLCFYFKRVACQEVCNLILIYLGIQQKKLGRFIYRCCCLTVFGWSHLSVASSAQSFTYY